VARRNQRHNFHLRKSGEGEPDQVFPEKPRRAADDKRTHSVYTISQVIHSSALMSRIATRPTTISLCAG
jgi:hypothetical protein